MTVILSQSDMVIIENFEPAQSFMFSWKSQNFQIFEDNIHKSEKINLMEQIEYQFIVSWQKEIQTKTRCVKLVGMDPI